MAESRSKREQESLDDDETGDNDWIGPMPSEATKPKKRKGIIT